jgi:hypothetical protein
MITWEAATKWSMGDMEYTVVNNNNGNMYSR